jgi:ABC-type Mn2+/Zn2+ transport system permease subunit
MSDGMIDFLTAPLAYPFMLRGLAAAVMVGVVCAVVGTFVVLRGMAFFGDALSHRRCSGGRWPQRSSARSASAR